MLFSTIKVDKGGCSESARERTHTNTHVYTRTAVRRWLATNAIKWKLKMSRMPHNREEHARRRCLLRTTPQINFRSRTPPQWFEVKPGKFSFKVFTTVPAHSILYSNDYGNKSYLWRSESNWFTINLGWVNLPPLRFKNLLSDGLHSGIHLS